MFLHNLCACDQQVAQTGRAIKDAGEGPGKDFLFSSARRIFPLPVWKIILWSRGRDGGDMIGPASQRLAHLFRVGGAVVGPGHASLVARAMI